MTVETFRAVRPSLSDELQSLRRATCVLDEASAGANEDSAKCWSEWQDFGFSSSAIEFNDFFGKRSDSCVYPGQRRRECLGHYATVLKQQANFVLDALAPPQTDACRR